MCHYLVSKLFLDEFYNVSYVSYITWQCLKKPNCETELEIPFYYVKYAVAIAAC